METGKVRSFIPPRLLPRLVWADEVEEEERRVEEAREHELREKEKVEREKVEREEMARAQAASALAERQRAERVRLEMERLKRVRAEKERREKERAAQRELEEREKTRREEEEAERRRAEREERKSLEKERVERAGGRMGPILESPEAACTVASVASSSLVADDVEQEREALRRTGAIPKRLASRGRQERNPRQSPVDSPASPDGNRGEEGGATSEEERSSRAAARELRDYLATGPVETPGEEPPGRPPSPSLSAPLRSARQGPEGHEREPVFQEPALPPQSSQNKES